MIQHVIFVCGIIVIWNKIIRVKYWDTQGNPKNPVGFTKTERNPKNLDNVNVNVNDNVNDSDSVSDSVNGPYGNALRYDPSPTVMLFTHNN